MMHHCLLCQVLWLDFSSSMDGFNSLTSCSFFLSICLCFFLFFSLCTHATFRSDPGSPKKCRARFGLNQQTDWCGPCRCVPRSRLSVCVCSALHESVTLHEHECFHDLLHCVSFTVLKLLILFHSQPAQLIHVM